MMYTRVLKTERETLLSKESERFFVCHFKEYTIEYIWHIFTVFWLKKQENFIENDAVLINYWFGQVQKRPTGHMGELQMC